MQHSYRIYALGDQAVTLEFEVSEIDETIRALVISMKTWIEKNPFDGMVDIIPGYRSISITFDLFRVSTTQRCDSASGFVREKLTRAYESCGSTKQSSHSRHLSIPVCYHPKFALDIEYIAEQKKISTGEIVRLHTAPVYQVYLIGFLPGFPYLGFVDTQLEVPRKSTPRAAIPAGSVGVAGKQTGIYPLQSPGGWQIIGRTPLRLFDPLRFPPALFDLEDRITFYEIDEKEFDRIHLSHESSGC
jgi:inhibitor of KinA